MKAPNASLITSFDIQSHDAGRETAIDNDRGGNMQAMRDLAKTLFFVLSDKLDGQAANP